MSYTEAKAKYAALGMDTDAAMEKLKTVPQRFSQPLKNKIKSTGCRSF